MIAYSRLIASDGYEVALFPFEYLYMSQDEGGDFSHAGTYNLDFLGWNANGRVYQCPIYAPCTLRCVDVFDPSSNTRVWESVNPVHLADGSLDYLTIYFSHDDNPIYSVGDICYQGNIIAHTGTTGYVTGDHTHTCCGKGQYSGFTQRQPNNLYDLTNRVHYWDALFVNDTNIVNGYSHNWIDYTGPVPHFTINKNNFNFVLFGYYAKQKRKRG